MGRANEEEAPGISDELPQQVKKAMNRKKPPSLQEILKEIEKQPPSQSYKPLQYPDRPLQTNTKHLGLTKPHEYFNLFFQREQFDYFAKWTNKNAATRRAENHRMQMEKELDAGNIDPDNINRFKARPWTDTDGSEVGVFIGTFLLIGINTNDQIPEYWTKKTDKGQNPELAAVSLRINILRRLTY